MKSSVFYGKHDLRVVNQEKPVIKDYEVLVRIKACGVCGTDVHIYNGDKGAAECTPPVILGHEFSGIIEDIGSKVKRFNPGDRVCVDPNNYCGNCPACRGGTVHFCSQMIGYGTTVNGGFAEFCSVDEKQVYRLDDNTDFVSGAMTEPVACCVHGIDMCNLSLGSKVIVIGGGMIGLIMIQLARLSGAERVIMIEPVAKKLELAKKLGADICIDPHSADSKQILLSNGITDINCVIECVGSTTTIQQAIDLAGNKAVIMMFGLTKPDDEISIKPFTFFNKELELKSSFINPNTQQRALDLINSRRIDVQSMIHDVCSLDRLPEILSSADLRAQGKYIIDPSL